MPVDSPLVFSPHATVAAMAATRCCSSTNVVGGAGSLGICSRGLRAPPPGGATGAVEPTSGDFRAEMATDLAGLMSVAEGKGLLELAGASRRGGSTAGGTRDWVDGRGGLLCGLSGCILNCGCISGGFLNSCEMISLCWTRAPKGYGAMV